MSGGVRARGRRAGAVAVLLAVAVTVAGCASSVTVTVVNRCPEAIWVLAVDTQHQRMHSMLDYSFVFTDFREVFEVQPAGDGQIAVMVLGDGDRQSVTTIVPVADLVDQAAVPGTDGAVIVEGEMCLAQPDGAG